MPEYGEWRRETEWPKAIHPPRASARRAVGILERNIVIMPIITKTPTTDQEQRIGGRRCQTRDQLRLFFFELGNLAERTFEEGPFFTGRNQTKSQGIEDFGEGGHGLASELPCITRLRIAWFADARSDAMFVPPGIRGSWRSACLRKASRPASNTKRLGFERETWFQEGSQLPATRLEWESNHSWKVIPRHPQWCIGEQHPLCRFTGWRDCVN